MKREGTFCDRTIPTGAHTSDPCPGLALGNCIGCSQDVCSAHGSSSALSVSVQRQARNTTSHVELLRGGITMCWDCVEKSEKHKKALEENLLPTLAEAITVGVAAALASEAMKKTPER